MGFLKKPTVTKKEVGLLSGFSKVGFVKNYGLKVWILTFLQISYQNNAILLILIHKDVPGLHQSNISGNK